MIVGVPREIYPGERRVALVPAVLPSLAKVGLEAVVEAGAGAQAGYPDADFASKGAKIVADRSEVFRVSDIVVQVLGHGANDRNGSGDLPLFHRDQVLIGFLRPLGSAQSVQDLAGRGITSFSVELMPRITRAQSMDALSAMATVSGYKAVLLAADTLARFFPMLTTAAGTITPSRVLILGVGVAGLQAIATARRLGAVVSAYDVRPAVKEQVQSLGAKFVELPLESADAEDKGGYAKALSADAARRQQEMLGEKTKDFDVVVTTALVPGRTAPRLVTKETVAGMRPGSVIVDLAAEAGGNCELTEPDRVVVKHGVTIHGPTNLPATVPVHASQLYARNVTELLGELVKDRALKLDFEDEIVKGACVTHAGAIVNDAVKASLAAKKSA
jgi:NAD(P) transhydrogenase subunit alpha